MLMMTAALALSVGCGQGFKADESLSGLDQGSTSEGGSDGHGSQPPTNSEYQQLDMTGLVSGGVYDKVWATNLDKSANAVLMNLPLPGNPALVLETAIAQLPGAKLKTYQDSQQKTYVAVSIPLKYIVKAVSLPAATLPSGDALPSMPTADAPSLSLDLGNGDLKLYLYLGSNAVGLYIESSYIPSYMGMTLPIKSSTGTRVLGSFKVVAQKGSFKGGLFNTLSIAPEIAKILSDRVKQISQ
jgi:hypothetical protein